MERSFKTSILLYNPDVVFILGTVKCAFVHVLYITFNF